MNARKVLRKMLAGSKNLRFQELVGLVEALGFHLTRTHGSHHIFSHPDVSERINLQDVRGQAKPYQMRQVLEVMETNGLTLDAEEAEEEETNESEETP